MRIPSSLSNSSRLWTIVLASAMLGGCGPAAPATVTVIGKVTLNARPINSALIRFFGAKGEQIGAALIGQDGVFRATDLVPGEIKVTVEPFDVRAGMPGAAPKAPPGTPVIHGNGPTETATRIPARYKHVATSKLAFTIHPPDQTLEINLD
jgi:hypothetical protein